MINLLYHKLILVKANLFLSIRNCEKLILKAKTVYPYPYP
jgi:hypothetical protein